MIWNLVNSVYKDHLLWRFSAQCVLVKSRKIYFVYLILQNIYYNRIKDWVIESIIKNSKYDNDYTESEGFVNRQEIGLFYQYLIKLFVFR